MWVQMVGKDTMAYYIREQLVLRNTGKALSFSLLCCAPCDVIKACIELVECEYKKKVFTLVSRTWSAETFTLNPDISKTIKRSFNDFSPMLE